MKIVIHDRVVGVVVVESFEREHAFGDSEIGLLQTIVAGMGVALENARLFAETQRLLKETEQRNAELAVINSIQQGMAGELDFQAIVDLVGDKLREVFGSGDIGIRWHDASAAPASSCSTSTARRARAREPSPIPHGGLVVQMRVGPPAGDRERPAEMVAAATASTPGTDGAGRSCRAHPGQRPRCSA